VLLELSASVEQNSEHMIGKALVEHASRKVTRIHQAKSFKTLPGKGAYGKVEGKEVYVGSHALLEELKIEIHDQRIKALQEQGKTVVFTVVDGELAGAFALSDKIRKESFEAIKRLKREGLKVYMLTGDSKEVAQSVAKELGIDDYFARVMPDKKAEKVKLLKENGNRVAMVGDGINDAPALVTADVGIAIGAGTDVAIESADIILVRNDPRDVPRAIEISQKTYSKMVQNLWWAAGYNIITIPLAAGILSGFGIILPPAVGAVIMSLSTVIVALNSQTLKKYEPKGVEFIEKRILVTDPVCGMQIEPETAFSKLEYEGYTAYFCSQHCEEEFKKNPKNIFPNCKNNVTISKGENDGQQYYHKNSSSYPSSNGNRLLFQKIRSVEGWR